MSYLVANPERQVFSWWGSPWKSIKSVNSTNLCKCWLICACLGKLQLQESCRWLWYFHFNIEPESLTHIRIDSGSSFYIRNFKTLASFCGCAGRFVSYLVANPERQVFSWWGSPWKSIKSVNSTNLCKCWLICACLGKLQLQESCRWLWYFHFNIEPESLTHIRID